MIGKCVVIGTGFTPETVHAVELPASPTYSAMRAPLRMF